MPSTHRRLAAAIVAAAALGFVPPALAQQPATLADSVAAHQKQIAHGRQIFHGEGSCFACHGQQLEGGIAPTLRPHKWKNGDGTLEAIMKIIQTGVPGTAMVAHPGNINEAELKDVATYVWAVSRGAIKP
jgi:mono/diheme cytochrome c family protein